jgi:hypothetical protein
MHTLLHRLAAAYQATGSDRLFDALASEEETCAGIRRQRGANASAALSPL